MKGLGGITYGRSLQRQHPVTVWSKVLRPVQDGDELLAVQQEVEERRLQTPSKTGTL